jgi:hypothetical protein
MNTRTTAHNKLVGGVVSLTFKASFRTHKSMAAATNKRTSSSENICRFQGKCTEKKQAPHKNTTTKQNQTKCCLPIVKLNYQTGTAHDRHLLATSKYTLQNWSKERNARG